MQETLKNRVYATLTGQMCPGYEQPFVENAFVRGSFCANLYEDVRQAYDRLLERLNNKTGEDPDLENIIGAMMDIEMHIAYKMFDYGVYFARNGDI